MSESTPVPFYSGSIVMTEIISAKLPETFDLEGKNIDEFIKDNYSDLRLIANSNNHYMLELGNLNWVEFKDLS
tara:strand:- start:71715 stop:71933 length:219 start_codon:yes stop_codon:yes gene_type:complete